MSWSSQPQKSISPALPGFFVKRSREIQRSSQPEMWLHNPSEAKRKNTIIFSLVDHDCLLNMLPKKGGSGFSNLNPSISIYKKQHLPGFFSIILIKHDALRVFHHHKLEIGGYPPPNLRLEFSHHHPWDWNYPPLGKNCQQVGQQPPHQPTSRGGCTFAALRTLRTLGTLRGGNTHRVLQWFERVGA